MRVSERIAGWTVRLALAIAAVGLMGPATADGAAGQPWRLQLEPGLRLEKGTLLLPVTALDADGAPLPPPPPQDLRVGAAGRDLQAVAMLDPVPTVVLVISDQFLVQAAWHGADVLDPGAPHWLGVWDASGEPIRHRALRPSGGTPPPAPMPAPHVPRLWDAVLAGIGALALLPDEAPARRVILVVGDLREEDQSLHPMAACLEAARELAVPVHAAVIDGAAGPAIDRLRHLAEGSGGGLVRAVSALPALQAGLGRIAAAGGLLLADPGLDLPAEVSVTADGLPGPARGVVAARQRGRYRPGPGVIAAAVIVLAAAAGLVARRQWRRRPVGYLISVDRPQPWRRAIPAGGLTIGRTPDNGLTLAEKNVSKHHALVRWHRGQVQLVDLRSTNGTQVGGRHVRSAALSDGDLIVFGDAVTVQFRRRDPLARDRT